ncbi:hypothetical protein DL546_009717 [Coniochaeta pulveracea]|uniref:U1 small nuclear ribonucleoprotein C n=1 Tax=Coniochaeta pulveracea TaxID=177199 RepID=A0A420YP33_9PEZI|nr:hypothetical protein DL546_009717 [Coniochaeta pulveracea]
MPKFFCDYCDVYLTHDSMSVRKAHNSGRNHLRNVVDYYQQIGHEKAQSVIDSITSSYAAEGQAHANPMLPQNQPHGGFPGAPSFPGMVPPPGAFSAGPGAPPFPFPPPGAAGAPPFPFPPPGAAGAPPFPFPPPVSGASPAGATPFPFPPPGGRGAPPFPMPGGANAPPFPFPPPGNAGGAAPPFPFPPPGGAAGGFPAPHGQYPPGGDRR